MTEGAPETSADGLALLFARHRAELLRFLVARSGGADGEDLLHELWLKVASQPIGPVANGRAYLYRMASNLVLDHTRQRHRAMARDQDWLTAEGAAQAPVEDRPDPALLADEAIVRQQEVARLLAAIAALPPGAQRALRLHRLNGLSQADVAQSMGISRSGVEKHLALAMKHLRNSLANCGSAAAAPSGQPKGQEEGSPQAEKRR